MLFKMHIRTLLHICYFFVIAWLFYRILGGNMRIIAASARIS